jgi:hypothetical protein
MHRAPAAALALCLVCHGSVSRASACNDPQASGPPDTAATRQTDTPIVTLFEDPDARILRVEIDRAEALSYRYDHQYAIPHIWPLRSPGGQPMLVQHPDPYPHHRSLWIADRVKIADGREVDFYHCWKNYRDPDHPDQGFKSFIRHTGFESRDSSGVEASVVATLEWVIDDHTVALRERLAFHITALGDGEYLLDLAWTLTPADSAVTFTSDWVHYAWPFLRMDPAWSGDHGAVIEDDQGRRGQTATNEQYADWIDYSNTVGPEQAGIAILLPPADQPRKWLTREYGTFGPRRPDALSGTGFTLAPGESLSGRAAILVHKGDAASGRVADRYAAWIESIATDP